MIAVAGVGIVVDEDVALAERLEAAVLDRRLDRKAEVALEDRQADAPEVQALADDVVVGGLDHREAHPLRGRVEGGADDLDGDGIERHGSSSPR